uniref:Potassium channel domain-containing protein n=1 Tax=Ditylenchus dipsaci TaxID=166011 RepID=A0A915EKK0_9BILA
MDELIDEHQRQMFKQFDHPIKSNYLKCLVYNNGNYTDLWTISSAIFFTSTTIIPVGFGYITPLTSTGRIFLLFYSIIGLPLALMTLSDIGKFMCGLLFWCFNNSLHLTMSALVLLLLLYPVCAALSIHNFTDMNLVDSFHFSVSSMFTIGFGDLLPAVPFGYLILFIVFGVTLVTISIEVLATSVIHQVHYMGRQMSKARLLAGKMVQMAQKMSFGGEGVLGLGLAQFNVFSKLGLGAFSTQRTAVGGLEDRQNWIEDEEKLLYKRKLTLAYEPEINLDFVDF